MGIAYNPRTVTNGLVLCLDSANPKGYDSNENLLTYSKDFSSGWSSSLTVTLNNAVAPDGTLTAAKIQRPLNSGNSNIQQNPVLSTNTNYCYSAFIKLASSPDPTNSICSLSSANNLISPVYASISYNFATGAISSFGNLPSNSGVIAYPDGWYRIYMVINTSTQTNASLEIRPTSSNTVSDFYIWGAQLERGSSPSPYYATAGTAKNRGTTWTDLSGNGKNATAQNGVGYTLSNGGGLTFDGIDDHFTISQRETSSQFTYEAFLMPTNVSKDQMYVGTVSDGFYLRISGSRAFLSLTAGGSQRTLTHNTTLQNNEIYHIVSIYNGVQLKIYVNNVLTSGAVINAAMTGWGADRIGRWRDGDQRSFVGNIYCVRAYNIELTPQEIQQNFNATRSRFGI